MRGFYRLALALALVLTFGATSASADFVFDLVNANSDIKGSTGPYEQVTVHLVDSTHATITFDSLTNPATNTPYVMGAVNAANVNVNGAFTTSGVTLIPPNAGASTDSGNNVSEFGRFNLNVGLSDGFSPGSPAAEIKFNVAAASGNSWADAKSVLAANGSGNIAAAHTIVTNLPGQPSGFVSGISAVPEPGPLLGAGVVTLMGLGYTWHRRKRATA